MLGRARWSLSVDSRLRELAVILTSGGSGYVIAYTSRGRRKTTEIGYKQNSSRGRTAALCLRFVISLHVERTGKNHRYCVRAEWKNCSYSVFEVNLREEEGYLLVTREGLCHHAELYIESGEGRRRTGLPAEGEDRRHQLHGREEVWKEDYRYQPPGTAQRLQHEGGIQPQV